MRTITIRGVLLVMEEDGKSSIGLEEGLVAAASYFPVLGIVMLIIEKKSDFVRFHAVQSTLGFAFIAVFWLAFKWLAVPVYFAWIPSMAALGFSVVMMIKAYYGEEHRLPIIGNWAFAAVYESDPESKPEDLLAEKPPEGE